MSISIRKKKPILKLRPETQTRPLNSIPHFGFIRFRKTFEFYSYWEKSKGLKQGSLRTKRYQRRLTVAWTYFNPSVNSPSPTACIHWVTTPRCELSSHVVNTDLAGFVDSSGTKINKKNSCQASGVVRLLNIQNTRICYTIIQHTHYKLHLSHV